MNEATRNVNYREGVLKCDRSEYRSLKSPAWKGPGWYRFMGPAGTRLPESPPVFSNPLTEKVCGTHYTGWLNGHHPTNPGELVTRKVCFKSNTDTTCRHEKTTKIRHCGSYFVYYLHDVGTCSLRYCAE